MWWQVQRYLGVCPQHDVLWETMTCEEHLKLFAGFKGVPNEVLLLGQFGFRG
jgi:ATP-binding cassette subfamily A (ABC1) protein 3